MMSFRRAIALAAFFITAFFLFRNAQSSDSASIIRKPPPPKSENVPTAEAPVDADLLNKPPSTSSPNGGAGMAQRVQPAPAQKFIQDTSKMSLYDKLGYQYPYDVETRFPAYIWQTWKTDPSAQYFRFRNQEASWTHLNPSFVHEVITDDNAFNLLQVLYAAVPEVLEAYQALPQPVLKADFFRYLILLARGGIYSDIDTIALKSAQTWLPEAVPQKSIGLIIGIEADPDRPDWADWYSRRIQFCQWTIQSKPGHPVLRDIVARITAEALRRKRDGVFVSKEKSVVEFTGPAIWTDTIFDYFNDGRYFDLNHSTGAISYRNFTGMESSKKVGDVVILPITSFSPGVGQMGAGEVDDPMAFVKHDFEGTWKPEKERHIGG
ncbi:nucleotide-diphospho-sugar transferase [Xylariaceae sp. FL0255]|nr:nucleotide-diphospho-sugar transferase [Xylariaceae sp. FL0255]